MIGLQRGTVQLSPSREAWQQAFESERQKILSKAAALVADIHHVGSTAIPGLVAKPIIDMVAVVESFDVLPRFSECLASLNWIDRGWVRNDNYLFVLETAREFRTHHLHVVEAGSSQLQEYTVFNGALLKDPKLFEEYTALKESLEQRYPDDRKSYTAAKDDFICSVLIKHGVRIGA